MRLWKRKKNLTVEERIALAEKDAAKRRRKNHEYLTEAVAWETRGMCYFCHGSGSYNTWYDDGTVKVSCVVCDGTGAAKNLGNLRKLLKEGTAFDPKELQRQPGALKKAVAGKVTA